MVVVVVVVVIEVVVLIVVVVLTMVVVVAVVLFGMLFVLRLLLHIFVQGMIGIKKRGTGTSSPQFIFLFCQWIAVVHIVILGMGNSCLIFKPVYIVTQ